MTALQPELREVSRNAASFYVEITEKIDRDFWHKFETRWEPETFRVFDTLLGPGRHMVDVGGWIGPTALYAAALGAEVSVFEPDPVAFRKLQRNLARNPALARRVTCERTALNARTGTARLLSKELGNSMSGLVHGSAEHRRDHTTVRTLSVNEFSVLAQFRAADLIKIDIEGGEFDMVPAMRPILRERRPKLYLSLHGFFLPDDDQRPSRQSALADAISGYPYVYRAASGTWHRLEDADARLRDEAENGVLSGALVLSPEPVPGLL